MFHNSVRNKKNRDTTPPIDSPDKETFTGVLLEFSLLRSRRGEIFGGRGELLPETTPTMLSFIQSHMQRP